MRRSMMGFSPLRLRVDKGNWGRAGKHVGSLSRMRTGGWCQATTRTQVSQTSGLTELRLEGQQVALGRPLTWEPILELGEEWPSA